MQWITSPQENKVNVNEDSASAAIMHDLYKLLVSLYELRNIYAEGSTEVLIHSAVDSRKLSRLVHILFRTLSKALLS